ncbi:hypothetical protein GCM10009828_072830 [Actinoplanes couchii]|uniref:Uncharacterized protein n=1 Tax=Actinoplanes couchii TaxID=403638 RepID=A0ABQ3X0E8_9ACTN|nr:hypothetical protein Aco03nite_004100 [Actinoplanes couchii]
MFDVYSTDADPIGACSSSGVHSDGAPTTAGRLAEPCAGGCSGPSAGDQLISNGIENQVITAVATPTSADTTAVHLAQTGSRPVRIPSPVVPLRSS